MSLLSELDLVELKGDGKTPWDAFNDDSELDLVELKVMVSGPCPASMHHSELDLVELKVRLFQTIGDSRPSLNWTLWN